MEQKDPILEARRYLDNAKEILRDKAVKEDNFYQDSKYVKLAGHAMWTGCMIALDYALGIKKQRCRRKDIDDYKAAAAKVDKKLLYYVESGYNIIYMGMGYDGEKKATIVDICIETMNYIIDWCEHRMQNNAA